MPCPPFLFQSLPSLRHVSHLFPISPLICFFGSSSLSSYRYSSSNHSPSSLVLLLPIIPHLTITILPTLPLPFWLFISPSSFLSLLTVTLLLILYLPFWLFFSPLFHILSFQFLQPSISPFFFFFCYKFTITFSTSLSLPLIQSMFCLPKNMITLLPKNMK